MSTGPLQRMGGVLLGEPDLANGEASPRSAKLTKDLIDKKLFPLPFVIYNNQTH